MISGAVSSKWAKGTGGPAGDEAYNLVTHALRSEGADASEDGTGRGTPIVVAATLRGGEASHINGGGQVAVAFSENMRHELRLTDYAYQAAIGNFGVRRLTPRECERLQGFPDDWTRFDSEGKEISDSARYRMLGNAVCVNVASWIGQRIIEATQT